MRYLMSILCLLGCAVHAGTISTPPSGEQMFSALLKNSDIDLANEPLCNADIKLYEQISRALSVSYQSDNKTLLQSDCSPSKFDTPQGQVIEVWDCTLQINERSEKGEFISSSTIVFSLTQDTHEFINGSLRCR